MRNNVVNLDLIKEKRLEKRLSIADMSEKLGYSSYQAYHRKEKGQRELSIEDLTKLSNILNVPIEKFLI